MKYENIKFLMENSKQVPPVFPDDNCKTIVYCPDEKYFKYFSVSLQSILDHAEADEKFDIVVLTDFISDRNKNVACTIAKNNISIRYFSLSDMVPNLINSIKLEPKNYWSVSMYYKCFIPLIMRSYRKVLYCDCDTCVNGNLSPIFGIDFEGKSLLTVLDTISPKLEYDRDREYHMRYNLGLKNPKVYFNTGVLLFNNANINIEKYLEKFLSSLRNKKLLFPDQDILNIIFENDNKLISCKFNCQYTTLRWCPNYLDQVNKKYGEDFLSAGSNPLIIHYIGDVKPWHAPGELLSEYFWQYARKSPFYEEIIFENTRNESAVQISLLSNKKYIYMKKNIYTILSAITFGAFKDKYKKKRAKYRCMVNEIRRYRLK